MSLSNSSKMMNRKMSNWQAKRKIRSFAWITLKSFRNTSLAKSKPYKDGGNRCY